MYHKYIAKQHVFITIYICWVCMLNNFFFLLMGVYDQKSLETTVLQVKSKVLPWSLRAASW